MVNNNIFKPDAYLSSDHPFNRHDAAHPRPHIPDAIVYEIFKYLSVEETCRVLTICKSKMGEERFGALRRVLSLKTSLTIDELRKYQRLFSSEWISDGKENPSLSGLYEEGYFPPLENLTSLDLSNAENLTDEELIEIAKVCPNLTSIKIGNEEGYGGEQAMTAEGIRRLGELCPNLTSIGLFGCLSDRFRLAGLEAYPNLTSITILYGTKMTDSALEELSKCSKLKSITLHPCDEMSDTGATALAEGCPELSTLILVGSENNQNVVTDIGITSLAQRCPNLRKVGFSNIAYVTDIGIKSLATCPLTELSITESHVTDDGLKTLAERCRDLKVFDLPKSFEISDEGVIAIAKNCPNLEKVDLTSADITDASIEALGNCEKLSSLNLTRCHQLKGSSFEVFQRLSELTYLNLEECPSITDEAFKMIAANCLKLEHCYLSGDRITRDTSRLLRQNHPNATIHPMIYD